MSGQSIEMPNKDQFIYKKKINVVVFLEKQKQKKEAKAATWFLISSHLTCQFFLNLNPKTSLRSPS